MEKDRYISFDWAMKRMLRDKANFGVLEGLLTVLLEEKITIMELLESESNQMAEDDKFNRVDIKARDSKGEIIIIEVQNTREIYYLERILYGVAKAVTEHISLGKTYQEVKKVISVSILYFDIGKGSDYLYHGTAQFRGVHTGDELMITSKERDAIVRKSPKEIFPEYFLIRVNEFNQVAKTPLEQWVEYLKTGEISSEANAPGLSEARERLRYYNMSADDRHAYDEHVNAVMIQNDVLGTAKEEGLAEGIAKGLAEGRAKGLAEGRAKGLVEGKAEGRLEGRLEEKLSTARRLRAMGLDDDMIVQATGLARSELDDMDGVDNQ